MIRRPRALEASDGLLAASAGVLVFGLAFALVHLDVFASFQLVDTPLYERYGSAILEGEVPYRDFALEYPPGALPVFAIPALAGEADFRSAFEAVHGFLGALLAVIVALALARLGASRERVLVTACVVGLTPLLLGPVVLTRFDFWPAVLLALSLLAFVYERPRLALGVLAAAATAKLYPLVVLPLALVHVARRYGSGTALRGALVFVLVFAAIVGPFLALSPDGLLDSVRRQTDRPLQIESLAASILHVGDLAGLYLSAVETSFGSQNLVGMAPDAAATITTALQVLVVICVWVLFVRLGPERCSDIGVFLGASATVLVAFVALGKVISPQFMIWIVALVPLALASDRSRGGVPPVLWLVALALVLTHLWFPSRYWDLVLLNGGAAYFVLVRNLVLCALAATLAFAWLRPGAEREEELGIASERVAG